MYIAIVARELSPYTQSAARGVEIAELGGELISRGHRVVAIMPFPAGRDLKAHSLARRLNPVSFEDCGEKTSCIRYDGRTSSGIVVHLLEKKNIAAKSENDEWERADIESFCSGAAAMLSSLGEAPDWCLSFDSEASLVPAICSGSRAEKRTAHMLVASTLKGDLKSLSEGISKADKVVVSNPKTAASAQTLGFAPLASMLEDGSATVFLKPCGSFQPLDPAGKASLKAAFQMKTGLPVRSDPPLVLFAEPESPPFERALRSFLKGNVQAAAVGSGDWLKDLAGQYPDRLALMKDPISRDDALGAMDACVVGSNAELVDKCLQKGVVPVVGRELGLKLCDLEPSCESGSGIIVDELDANSVAEGLERLAAAYSHMSAFKSLAARLHGFTTTWPEIANQYLEIMEEAQEARTGD